jgi:predicted site-specific integrase-resolvase
MLHHDTVLLKKEAAQLLKISMTGLGRLLAEGRLARVQITPRRIGILKSDLDSFLQSNRMVGGSI